jgi:hypothetical protein
MVSSLGLRRVLDLLGEMGIASRVDENVLGRYPTSRTCRGSEVS